jgi:hypothetical protein
MRAPTNANAAMGVFYGRRRRSATLKMGEI